MKSFQSKGFSLIECMISVAIAGLLFMATLALLGYARLNNQLEQERSRAHQIVSQALEGKSHDLAALSSSQQTVWDNNTPSDPSDDTVGSLQVTVTDPKTGVVLTPGMVPKPWPMVRIEATLSWNGRASLSGKTYRETVMTFRAPD